MRTTGYPPDTAVCPRRRKSHLGHEDAFPPPRLSGRCRFSQGTFAGRRGKGQDAPITDLGGTEVERQCSTQAV
jgi:hypothetical protein